MVPASHLSRCAVSSQNLTYEIILTLGQAFEVAYQLALQAQKSRPMGASAAEMIETKSSKPVPKPRVGMRKSAVRGPRGGAGARRVFSRFRWPAPQDTGPCEPASVTPPRVCVCFAPHPRCRCPLIVAVVTVTPAPPIVLLTSRCRLLVLESRSLHFLLSVYQSPRSDRELSETLVPRPRPRLHARLS